MHEINITMKVENKKKKLPNITCKKDADMIKFEAKNKYKNMSEKEKKKKRKYQRERYYMVNLNEKLKQYQRDYYASKKIKK